MTRDAGAPTAEKAQRTSRVTELEKLLKESDERMHRYDAAWSDEKAKLQNELGAFKTTTEIALDLLETVSFENSPVLGSVKKILAKRLGRENPTTTKKP